MSGSDVIRTVGIDSLLDGPSREVERTAPRGNFDRLEIQAIDRTGAYEVGNLGEDVRIEGFSEAPFFSPSPTGADALSFVSQIRSLIPTNSRVSWRSRRYSAIWSWVWATALDGMTRVMVLPLTWWVNDQLGPCPLSPWAAQWQFGLPHLR
jgi:hypothetical protein